MQLHVDFHQKLGYSQQLHYVFQIDLWIEVVSCKVQALGHLFLLLEPLGAAETAEVAANPPPLKDPGEEVAVVEGLSCSQWLYFVLQVALELIFLWIVIEHDHFWLALEEVQRTESLHFILESCVVVQQELHQTCDCYGLTTKDGEDFHQRGLWVYYKMSFLTLIDANVNETFLLMDISFNLGIERL